MGHEVTSKQLRIFGVGFFWILAGFGGLFLWKGSTLVGFALLGLGLVFGGFGVFSPSLLKPIYEPWMLLAEKLAWLNTRLLLAAIFFLVLTPMGMVMRLFGKDPMQRMMKAESYWMKSVEREKIHFERQF